MCLLIYLCYLCGDINSFSARTQCPRCFDWLRWDTSSPVDLLSVSCDAPCADKAYGSNLWHQRSYRKLGSRLYSSLLAFCLSLSQMRKAARTRHSSYLCTNDLLLHSASPPIRNHFSSASRFISCHANPSQTKEESYKPLCKSGPVGLYLKPSGSWLTFKEHFNAQKFKEKVLEMS